MSRRLPKGMVSAWLMTFYSPILRRLGQAIFAVAAQNNWKVNEIKKEEGRLDDVFRNITLSDTKPQ